MRNFVENLKMVLADNQEYSFSKITKAELDKKMVQDNFEGLVYSEIFKLIEDNKELIKKARPKVSKNSSGYALWDVWDGENFDPNQLFVGSQGTLGIMTEAQVRLVKEKKQKNSLRYFSKVGTSCPGVVNAILPYDPESMEAFDDTTLKLGLRFMPEIAQKAEMSLFRFARQFLPEVIIGMKMFRMPKLIVLIQLAEDDLRTLLEKTDQVEEHLSNLKFMLEQFIASKKRIRTG